QSIQQTRRVVVGVKIGEKLLRFRHACRERRFGTRRAPDNVRQEYSGGSDGAAATYASRASRWNHGKDASFNAS
ncbi:MAG: hypothetical protein AAFN70_01650, partial [Planctomycetota bacterium]